MAQSSSNSSSSTTRRSLRLLAAEKKSNSNSSTIETPEDETSSHSNPRQAKSKALEALSHSQSKRRRESDIDLSDETDETTTKRRILHSQRKSSSKRQRASISDDDNDDDDNNSERRRKTSDNDRTSESTETGNHCLRRGSGGRDLHPISSEPSTSHHHHHHRHHSRRSRRYSPKPYLDYLSTSQSRLPTLTNSNPSETRLCESSHPSSSDPPIHLFHSPTYFPSTSSPPRSSSSAQSYSGLVPNLSYRNPSAASAATTAKPSLTMSTESDTDPETSPTSRDLISDPSFLRAAANSGSASAAFLQTLSGRVHHLMSRVGGNSSLNSRLQQYIQGMQSPDPDVKLSTLNELCSLLVMSNEDTLPSFQCRALYAPLRDCLADENEANSEIVLTACRALTYLMEALPRAAMQVVEATPIFLSKLRSITSIDIAEQALIALEMISRRNAKQILIADGIAACLAFIEFFSITSQNKALTIVANCCSHINTSNDFKYIREHLPVLAARLQSDDKKTIEHVCTIFSRLVENFHRDSTILCEIISTDLLKTFQTMIVVQPSLLNSVTFLSIIHLLYICSASCPKLAVTLLKMNIAETVVCLLTGSAESKNVLRKSITYKSAVLPNNTDSPVITSIQSNIPIELVSRTPQELYEIVSLIGEMMPKLPSDEPLFQVEQYFHANRFDDPQATSPALWHWQDDDGQLRPYSYQESRLIEAAWQQHEEEIQLMIDGRPYLLDLQQFQQVNEETNQARFIKRIIQSSTPPPTLAADSLTTISKPLDARMEILNDHLDVYQNFVQSLFTILYEVYNSSAGPAVKHRCLQSLLRMIFYSPSDLLESILRQQSISSHIASMLASSDPKIVISALQISEILMKKLPDIFSVYFYREGVIHQIEILIGLGVASSSNLSIPPRALHSSSGTHSQTDLAHLPDPSTQTNPMHRGATSQLHPKTLSTPYRGGTSSRRYANDSTNQRIETRSQRAAAGGTRATAAAAAAAARTKSVFDSSPTDSAIRGRPIRPASTYNRMYVPMGFASSAPTASSLFISNAFSSANDEKSHLKEWIENQARHFRSTYFAENSSQSNIALEIIRRLESAVERLHVGKEQQENQRALKDIAQILSKGDVSPFEIVHSGLISKLFQYLTDDLTVPNERSQRIKGFLHVFASIPDEKDLKQFIIDLHHHQLQQDKSSSSNILHHLISKLHGCINQLEQFPIRVNDTAGRSVHQSALRLISSHQLKCNLVRHPQCKTLKQWNSGPVKIDPFALVSVLEKYLLLRGIASGPLDDPSETIDDEDSEVSNESDDDIINVLAHSPMMRLEFLINEHVIPHNMTLFQAIRMYGRSNQRATDEESETDNDESIFPSTALWTRVHTITYRQVTSSTSGVPAVSQAIGGATTTTTTTTTSSSSSSRIRGHQTTTTNSATATGKISKKNNKTPKRTSAAPVVDDLWINGHCPSSKSLLQQHLNESISSMLTINDLSLNAISLLHILNALNLHWYDLYQHTNTMITSEQNSNLTLTHSNEFISSKLTSKVNRQLQDPVVLMMGHIPSWITGIGYKCLFLFPFESRQMIFYTNAFDRERAMQRLIDNSDLLTQQQQQQQQSQQQESHERQNITPRVERKKIQLSRANILNEMEKVLENWNSKQILEVQYEDEVGFGLGPTLEAYSLISKELQKTGLELWRTDKTLELHREKDQILPEYVDNRYGLFPAPLGRNAKSNLVTKVRQKFKFLGKFMAKALMDSRMIDMPFSLVFFKWMLADEDSLTLEDLHHVDRNLYEQLKKLQTIVQRRDEVLVENQTLNTKSTTTTTTTTATTTMSSGRKSATRTPMETANIEEDARLYLDGCSIEDLGLVFTLPAHPNIELKKNGKDCSVTILNLDQYIQLVVHWTLIEGVRRQFESFRDGFNSIFSIKHLKSFYPDELHQVFCGSGSTDFWDLKVLLESTRCDHGYNLNSRAVKWLFELMVNFDLDEQRAFLQFVTGSPRLPVGGFRMLHPPLTIVRKTAENTSETNQTDQALPSVMTCVNYLKLPDYSSKEIMKVKLTTAIRDGQYAFLLS